MNWKALLAAALSCGASLGGQQPGSGVIPLAGVCLGDLTAGSPTERTALIAALVSSEPVSTVMRPLHGRAAHQLIEAGDRVPTDSATSCPARWQLPQAEAWYNTTAARPDRDGAVWEGRGLTLSLTGGVRVDNAWRVSLALQPIATFSQNREFSPLPAGLRAPGDFRDPGWGSAIDLPYRFGDRAYWRIDPGESYARVDLWHFGGGVSTASQHWGPAHFYPLVMGTESAGYPRAFAEATRLPLRIGDASAQWQLGYLEASPYSGLAPGQRSRVLSAVVASFRPRALSMLEIGGARLFHVRRDSGAVSWSTATLPFSGLLKRGSSEASIGGFNQLGSVFARLAPSGAGIEVYGELYREDHNYDFRDLVGEPDHESAYVLGLRRAWKDDGGYRALTIEHANGRITHLARVRGELPMYIHSGVNEGHTYLGQPLGSSAVLGGGGSVVSWSVVRPATSRTVTMEIRPQAQNQEGGTWNGEEGGEYVLSADESRIVRRRLYGASIGVSVGYGFVRRSNVTLGLSRRW